MVKGLTVTLTLTRVSEIAKLSYSLVGLGHVPVFLTHSTSERVEEDN